VTRYSVVLHAKDEKVILRLNITAADDTEAHIKADRLAGDYRAATYALTRKGGAK
jgi:hypothetical protein